MLLQLYLSFALVGLLTIGGGYASLPIIQEQAVTIHGWLTMTEFTDLLTIAEITPGPIAINSATYVGTKVAGIPGAVIATLGFATCPFIVVSVFFFLYKKYRELNIMQGVLSGLKPAVVALIASAGLSILILALWGEGGFSLANTNLLSIFIIAAGFFVLRKWKPNPIIIIFGSGVIGLAAEIIKSIF